MSGVQIAGPDRGRQSENAVIGQRQRMVHVIHRNGRGDRAENLFLSDAHLIIDVSEQGRLDIVPIRKPRRHVAAKGQVCAFVFASVDIAQDAVLLLVCDQRPDCGFDIQRIADPGGCAGDLGEFFKEFVIDRALHQ